MTLLMVGVTDERAQLWTDTLTTADQHGVRRPHCHTSKVHVLPHLDAVIAGVGMWDLQAEWQACVATTPVRDILELDAIAPVRLREIWRWLGDNIARDLTLERSVIYHVGRKADRLYTGFLYDSKYDFESETLESGSMMIEPAPHFDLSTPPSGLRGCIDFVERLRADEAARIERDESTDADGHRTAVEIGGELVLVELHDGIIETIKAHRFASYWDELDAMDRPSRVVT